MSFFILSHGEIKALEIHYEVKRSLQCCRLCGVCNLRGWSGAPRGRSGGGLAGEVQGGGRVLHEMVYDGKVPHGEVQDRGRVLGGRASHGRTLDGRALGGRDHGEVGDHHG